jgi:DNA-binding CsgD family transcriptional regulator
MRSRFWTFVEACDAAQSMRAVKDLLLATLRSQGVDGFAILTHVPPRELGSLGVLVHNWSQDAIDHLYAEGAINPIFETIEGMDGLLDWSSSDWRAALRKDQRTWLHRLRVLVPGEGVTKSLKSMLVNASCSLNSPVRLQSEQIQLCMHIANYAYQHIQTLQRPQLRESERLTQREHECLYRAAIQGERPSAVARELGVKVSTVRTLRQKAYGRLGADSPEQALWRMMETGQLFKGGRKTRRQS